MGVKQELCENRMWILKDVGRFPSVGSGGSASVVSFVTLMMVKHVLLGCCHHKLRNTHSHAQLCRFTNIQTHTHTDTVPELVQMMVPTCFSAGYTRFRLCPRLEQRGCVSVCVCVLFLSVCMFTFQRLIG